MDIMLDDRFDVKPMDVFRWWLAHNEKFLCEKAFQILNEGKGIFWTVEDMCKYLGLPEKFYASIEEKGKIRPKCVYFSHDKITIYKADHSGRYSIEKIIDHNLDIFYDLIMKEDFFVMYLSDIKWKNIHYYVEVR